MTSNIDLTIPVYGVPTTASVRSNFAIAQSEISALQLATPGAPFLPLSGGTMIGALILAADPTAALQAATKNYVDNAVAGGSGGGGGLPDAPSDGASYGRSDAFWVPVLPLSGGIVSGNLQVTGSLAAATVTLGSNPTTALEAATKGYCDSSFLPLAGGTVTGNLAVGGAISPNHTAGILGTTTNDNTAAGSVGEYLSVTVPRDSAVPITSGATITVTSLTLSAGDWDVSGVVSFLTSGVTGLYATLAISLSPAAFSFASPGGGLTEVGNLTNPGTVFATFPTGSVRLALAAATTVYLVSNGQFGGTFPTLAAYGFIGARRAR